jgi:serine phosphatase RsbU (regulator of sigma subunit)
MNWESSLGDVQITGGDVLVIYTDGIAEANNADGEEFARAGFSTQSAAISLRRFR